MAGQVPTSGYKIMQDTGGDTSIADNVKGTHASSTLYTDFDSLRTNAINVMMDTTFNPGKITPTNSDMFRGYPKPTTTMNFEEADNLPAPFERFEELFVDAPSINNKVGFSFQLTLAVTERRSDTSAILGTHNETLLWLAGSTEADSSPSGMPFTGGKGWRVSDFEATAVYDVDVSIVITGNHPFYGAASHNATLNFSASTISAHLFTPISELSCAGTFSPTPGTCFAASGVLSNGLTLYTSVALTSTISDDDYALDSEDANNFFFATTTTGIISGLTECFE